MAVCPNYRIECPVAGCSRSLRRADMGDHLVRCPWRQCRCPSCNLCLPWILLSEHKTNKCLERFVQCSFAEYGCTIKMKVKDLPTHLEGNELRHLSIKWAAFFIRPTDPTVNDSCFRGGRRSHSRGCALPHDPMDIFRDKEGNRSTHGGKFLVLAHIEQYRARKKQLSFTVGSVGRIKRIRHISFSRVS